MKSSLFLCLVAALLLPGCAEERPGNGVNIHEDLGRRYWAQPETEVQTRRHTRVSYAK
jgi:outer membrane biogenesis lipoprotein LolB